LANLTKGIQTPPQITRQGNIQTANYWYGQKIINNRRREK
jgi:hypothetical protein